MTQRRPTGMSTGSWTEQQIRQAQAQGAFEDLRGMGKPIPDLLKEESDLDFAARLARREQLDASVFLPPALALGREAELLPERVLKERSEKRVRELAEDLNERIRKERLKPQDGPPVRARLVDVEQLVADWQAARPIPAVVPKPAEPPRRRWWRR